MRIVKVQTLAEGGCNSKRGGESCFFWKWVEWHGYGSL